MQNIEHKGTPDRIVYIKNTSRIHSGHLWIFSNEISGSIKGCLPGSIVELRDKKDNFLAIAYINPHSLISARILTRKKEKINKAFFENRIKKAISYRERLLGKEIGSCRLIFSESDMLPGLIVDKYAGWIVIQSLTAGMDNFIPLIAEILDRLLNPEIIFLKNDLPQRNLEGLELTTTFLKGSGDSLPVISEGEIFLKVDPVHGQKTGFFLDQRENRIELAKIIKKGRGLDLFCYTGAWGLHLAKNGAEVLFIDSSEIAIGLAQENAKLNNLESRCSFLREDVFDYLTNCLKSTKRFDFIILDPPAFVKAKSKIREAIRGYRFINNACMRLLKKGGILATSSCSYHISRETFLQILLKAAIDAGRTVRIIDFRGQSRDHPVLLNVPETAYLKCAILEVD